MNYTLDCEFNGYQGELLSFALYCENSTSFYALINTSDPDPAAAIRPDFTPTPWVAEHVVPHLHTVPTGCTHPVFGSWTKVQQRLRDFLHHDDRPVIHVDWPDDIKYFCELLLTGPGTMIDIPRVEFKLHRVESYPNTGFRDAIQHHAWWDARLLYDRICPTL